MSKHERHARREAIAFPRIAFRSSKSRNFIPRNASSLPLSSRLISLQLRVRGTHATVREHVCTRTASLDAIDSAPHLPASVFRESKRERDFFSPPSSPFFISWLTPCAALRIPFGSRSLKRLSYLFATCTLCCLFPSPPSASASVE